MTAVKGTRVEISAGKYYPTLDGRQARAAREAGAFDYGGVGRSSRLNLKVPLRLRREQYNKNLDKPLYTGLFEVFV